MFSKNKNENVKKFINIQIGIDWKTRWGSTTKMLATFLEFLKGYHNTGKAKINQICYHKFRFHSQRFPKRSLISRSKTINNIKA